MCASGGGNINGTLRIRSRGAGPPVYGLPDMPSWTSLGCSGSAASAAAMGAGRHPMMQAMARTPARMKNILCSCVIMRPFECRAVQEIRSYRRYVQFVLCHRNRTIWGAWQSECSRVDAGSSENALNPAPRPRVLRLLLRHAGLTGDELPRRVGRNLRLRCQRIC